MSKGVWKPPRQCEREREREEGGSEREREREEGGREGGRERGDGKRARASEREAHTHTHIHSLTLSHKLTFVAAIGSVMLKDFVHAAPQPASAVPE